MRWSRGGPVEGFVRVYREPETWSGFYSKPVFFFSHDTQLYVLPEK